MSTMADKATQTSFCNLMKLIERRKANLVDFKRTDQMDFTLKECKADFLDGEEGVAFEMLVDNLFELRFPMTSEIYDAIACFGKSLGLPENKWLRLREVKVGV